MVPTNAAALLGMKVTEIAEIVEADEGTIIVTKAGTKHIVVPEHSPDGDGKTGLMLFEKPDPDRVYASPVYTPIDEDEMEAEHTTDAECWCEPEVETVPAPRDVEPEWNMGMSPSGNRHYNPNAKPPAGFKVDEEKNQLVPVNEVPDGEHDATDDADVTPVNLKRLKVPDLADHARSLGIDIPEGATRKPIMAALDEHEASDD